MHRNIYIFSEFLISPMNKRQSYIIFIFIVIATPVWAAMSKGVDGAARDTGVTTAGDSSIAIYCAYKDMLFFRISSVQQNISKSFQLNKILPVSMGKM
jgi:hypothetical protein